jgi:outer membrane protein OmpA-like peptidoglycan-associated protein
MFVTAEPHYLVRLPSRFVVLETKRTMPGETVQYRGYEGLYNYERDTLGDAREASGRVENDVKQALAAVRIAERAGANEFARAELDKARASLQNTLAISEQRKNPSEVDTAARETVSQAVAAQTLAEDRAYQAALDSERRARDEQVAELEEKYAQAADEAERAQLKAEQEQMKLQFDTQAREDALRRAVEEQRLRLAAERKAAEAAQSKAAAEGRTRELSAANQKALKEREESYRQMRDALARITETRESVRGLIVNIPDVLFDSNSATLRPEGRERLSKITGIILATPGMWGLSVEGYTDSVGSDSYNQSFSERRAETVRSYMVSSGVPREAVTARGFGGSKPIASNDTNEGRQRNRRVEIIIEDRQKISSHQ